MFCGHQFVSLFELLKRGDFRANQTRKGPSGIVRAAAAAPAAAASTAAAGPGTLRAPGRVRPGLRGSKQIARQVQDEQVRGRGVRMNDTNKDTPARRRDNPFSQVEIIYCLDFLRNKI
jgi:hypothetical protein